MTADEIKERLKAVKYPGFSRDIVSFGIVKEISLDEKALQVRLLVVTEDEEVRQQIVAGVEAVLDSITGLPAVDIIVERPQTSASGHSAPRTAGAGGDHGAGHGAGTIPGISRILAVASAKGGVGKSTVAANLAVSMVALGFSTGLLDADIYGPSIPTMFGVDPQERLGQSEDGKLLPIERHGVKLVSMGFFVPPGSALIWRGPMLTKALTQFIGDVRWGDLDYLILDLPPGTGDVQMTLTQRLAMDGGVIVTTPQDVALADVERGIRMFKQAKAPVAGVVENMSFHVCPCCGERTHLFGEGGGARVAERYDVPFLGGIPLLRTVREGGDAGCPVARSEPDGEVGLAFLDLARKLSTAMPAREVGHA